MDPAIDSDVDTPADGPNTGETRSYREETAYCMRSVPDITSIHMDENASNAKPRVDT